MTMKKAARIVIFFCMLLSFVQMATAQEGKSYSTIYFYRPKEFAGSACSYRVKMGNQDFFNLNNGGMAAFKIYSTGKITVTYIISCGGTGGDFNLEIEPGKEYFLKAKLKTGFATASVVFLPEDEEASKKYLDKSKATSYEEDLRMPINSSATENAHKSEKGQGTCFLISANGYLITNNHCIEGAKEITVKGIDGDFTTKYVATVVATDPSNDLALLKLGNKNLKFTAPPIALRSSGVAQAEKVYALGFPKANTMGEEVKITEGIISSKSGVQGDISKFQISAAVNPGNSGGPLIDEQGNVIGVIYAKSTVAESAGYAIKAGYLETFLKNIENFEYPNLVNTIKDKPLTEKVAEWKKYIFIIETN